MAAGMGVRRRSESEREQRREWKKGGTSQKGGAEAAFIFADAALEEKPMGTNVCDRGKHLRSSSIPIQPESGSNNRGHQMEDPTAMRFWSDVDVVPLKGPNGQRGSE